MPKRIQVMRSAVLLTALGLGGMLTAESAYPRPRIDQAHSLYFGESAGAYVAARADSERSGRARVSLPRALAQRWRGRLTGAVQFGGVADGRGNVFFVTDEPRAVKLSSRGSIEWSQKLDKPPATSPVLASSGNLLVLTQSGTVYGLTPRGSSAFPPRSVAGALPRSVAAPLPSIGGGAVFAVGRVLFHVGESGDVLEQTSLPTTVRWLLESEGRRVAVTEDGDVFSWAHHATSKLGSLSPPPRYSPAISSGALLAVSGDRLQLMDLHGGAVRQLDERPPGDFVTAPVVTAPGHAVLLTEGGTLLSYDFSAGTTKVAHVAGIRMSAAPRTSYDLVADAEGTLIVASSAGVVTAVAKSGESASRQLDCGSSGFLVPHDARALVFACPSGQLWSLGSAGALRAAPAPPAGE